MGCFLTNTAIINPSIKPIQTGPPTKAEIPKKENKLKVLIVIPSKNFLDIFFLFFRWFVGRELAFILLLTKSIVIKT